METELQPPSSDVLASFTQAYIVLKPDLIVFFFFFFTYLYAVEYAIWLKTLEFTICQSNLNCFMNVNRKSCFLLIIIIIIGLVVCVLVV